MFFTRRPDAGSFSVIILVRSGSEAFNNLPSWKDRERPKNEVEVDSTDFSKNRDRLETVAQGLPG